MTDGERDYYGSWQLAVACKRAEIEAGRKLTPKEMLKWLDAEEWNRARLKKTAAQLREMDI